MSAAKHYKYTMTNLYRHLFTRCLLFHTKGVWEEGGEENISMKEGENTRRLEKTEFHNFSTKYN
jgi:hypothetical protein